MKEIAQEIRKTIEDALDVLKAVSPEEAAFKQSPTSWSKKEILGHLIDSAANNHQRFVRACYDAAADFPPYDQIEWVQIQQYKQSEWKDLIGFWAAYNFHITNLIERIPEASLSSPVNIGRDEPVTLEFVIVDYLRHLQHHVNDLVKVE